MASQLRPPGLRLKKRDTLNHNNEILSSFQIELSDIDLRYIFGICSLVEPEINFITDSKLFDDAKYYCGENNIMKVMVFIRISIELFYYKFITKEEYDYDSVLSVIENFDDWRNEKNLENYDDLIKYVNYCLILIHGDDSIHRYQGTFLNFLNLRKE